MKIHLKFISIIFLKSFLFVFFIFFSLVFVLNLLSEIEFFKNIPINNYITVHLSLLNSPALVFEMLPFILLLSTQVFYIKLLENNEIQIFKYSGLKNSKLILITSIITFILSLLLITFFYNFSSNLKKIYLEYKNQYTGDGKYLAVITKNGLWIKDVVDNKTTIINASKIDNNFLINTSLTQLDSNYNSIKTIISEKIDISKNEWILLNSKVLSQENSSYEEKLNFKSNFDYIRIQNLFSDLSSLSLIGLIELRNNYLNLNYSTLEVNAHLMKLSSYPLYLILMSMLSSIMMLNSKQFKNSTAKIAAGLFSCVVIYYINNLFYIMGITEKIYLLIAIWAPLLLLFLINMFMLADINEK